MSNRIVTAFAPATVSNVACGFDVLGFALEAPGDEVTARFAPAGVTIDAITGDDGRLPREAMRNPAGVAAEAIPQGANMGALADGLHRADFAVIARSLEDSIAEPRRAPLVPGLAAIKQAALAAGALGCSFSGSGPSLFALCRGGVIARAVA